MSFALRSKKPNWFPTLSEINDACDKAAAQRQALLRTLQSAHQDLAA